MNTSPLQPSQPINRHRQRRLYEALALGLIGTGLVILGILAAVLLPKALSGDPPGTGKDGIEFSAVPMMVNFPAPDLSLTSLGGELVSLADYRGQTVLVNNWAAWCPPCKAEMPVLQAYFEDHRDGGFVLIGIEAGEPISEVAAFVADYGLTFPVWPDPQQAALQAFRNLSLPNSYLIDREGTVRLAWTGAITQEMLEKHVTPLIGE